MDELTFPPVADTFVSANSPSANFGNATAIEVDGSPEKISYLRFDVSGLSGAVQTALIKLTATDPSQFGGRVYPISYNSWDEDSVTYNTRPTLDSIPLFDLGAVSVGDVVEIDVTSAIIGDGIYSFAIVSDNRNGADYHSREALNNPPELIVTTDGKSFMPIADASVAANTPDTNFGSADILEVDGRAEKISYLRFDVNGITESVQSARIVLNVVDESPFGGTVHLMSNTSWNEDTVTYNNRPAVDGSALDSLGPVSVGNVVVLDVTDAVTGNGIYNFAIASDNSDGADYYSSENLNGSPKLLITATME
jgi:hypothetical protein